MEEFKTISFTWKSSDITPDKMSTPVIYLTKNEKFGTFKNTYTTKIVNNKEEKHSNWEWLKEKYSIVAWAYQYELLP